MNLSAKSGHIYSSKRRWLSKKKQSKKPLRTILGERWAVIVLHLCMSDVIIRTVTTTFLRLVCCFWKHNRKWSLFRSKPHHYNIWSYVGKTKWFVKNVMLCWKSSFDLWLRCLVYQQRGQIKVQVELTVNQKCFSGDVRKQPVGHYFVTIQK